MVLVPRVQNKKQRQGKKAKMATKNDAKMIIDALFGTYDRLNDTAANLPSFGKVFDQYHPDHVEDYIRKMVEKQMATKDNKKSEVKQENQMVNCLLKNEKNEDGNDELTISYLLPDFPKYKDLIKVEYIGYEDHNLLSVSSGNFSIPFIGKFDRKVTVNKNYNMNELSTNYADGVLTITIPKFVADEQEKTSVEINIDSKKKNKK